MQTRKYVTRETVVWVQTKRLVTIDRWLILF